MTDTTTEAEAEAIAPDEVTGPDQAPGTELATRDAPTALEAAAQATLEAPGAMDHSEFWALAAQARILSMSGGAPKAIREDPHLALHVAMIGRDLGISASAAVELIDVIPGRNGEKRLSLSPQLMNGQLRRLGIGCILPAVRTNTECTAVAFGPGGPDKRCTKTGVVVHVDDCACDVLGTSEFTWEDARIATLVAQDCQPGNHTQRCRNSQTHASLRCNQGYVTYPKRMLWWRASGFAADDYFPEAGLGLYSPEALGASVGADGRPIDVESVELPPGYEPPELPAGTRDRAQPQAEPGADPAELWQLQLRLYALPEGARQELRDAWTSEESRVRGYMLHKLPRSKLQAAKALVNAHWGKARKAGVDQDAEIHALRQQLAVAVTAAFGCPATAAQDAQETPEPPPAPAAPTEPPEPDSGPQEPADEQPDWVAEGRMLAAAVRKAAEGIPEKVIERIGADVKALHHARVNEELADSDLADWWPPAAPIDMRRMAVCLLRLEAFRASGVVPGSEA